MKIGSTKIPSVLVLQNFAVFLGQAVKLQGRNCHHWTDVSKEAFNEGLEDILNLDCGCPSKYKYWVIRSWVFLKKIKIKTFRAYWLWSKCKVFQSRKCNWFSDSNIKMIMLINWKILQYFVVFTHQTLHIKDFRKNLLD